jgi:hypothetical protein
MAGLLFGICAMRVGSIFSVSATMSVGLCASQFDRPISSNRSALKTSGRRRVLESRLVACKARVLRPRVD